MKASNYMVDVTTTGDSMCDNNFEPIKQEIRKLKLLRRLLRQQIVRQQQLANQKKRLEKQTQKLQNKLDLFKVRNSKSAR